MENTVITNDATINEISNYFTNLQVDDKDKDKIEYVINLAKVQANNKEKHKAYLKEYRVEHKAKMKEATIKWQESNKEAYKESQKKWAVKNRAYFKEYQRTIRLKKLEALAKLQEQVLENNENVKQEINHDINILETL
jgi:hypothetical protein